MADCRLYSSYDSFCTILDTVERNKHAITDSIASGYIFNDQFRIHCTHTRNFHIGLDFQHEDYNGQSFLRQLFHHFNAKAA